MYKEELFKLADSLNLPNEEFCIISGGALVAHGLREQTNDLDIDITQKGLEILKKKFNIELINEEKKQYINFDESHSFIRYLGISFIKREGLLNCCSPLRKRLLAQLRESFSLALVMPT